MNINQVYRIGRTMGSGSFGTVVHGVNRITKEHVAIKIVSKQMCFKKGVRINDVLREIKLLSKIRHENLISLVDWYEDESCFYIITKLARGGELFDRIIELNFFSERDAVDVITKLLKSVVYLHDHDIVHRDIKPENILYMKPGDNSSIVLCDFGLAIEHFPYEHKLKGTPGTPTYRAPEIFTKQGHDSKVDIWGIGIIAYILITGRVPISQDSNVKQFSALVNHPDFPAFIQPDEKTKLSKASKNFVRQCLNPNPSLRPSARQLLQHTWIVGNTALGNYNLVPGIRSNFNAKKALQQAIRKVIIENNLKQLRQLNNEEQQSINILAIPNRYSNNSLFSYNSSNNSFSSLSSSASMKSFSGDMDSVGGSDSDEYMDESVRRARRRSSLNVQILQEVVRTISADSDSFR